MSKGELSQVRPRCLSATPKTSEEIGCLPGGGETLFGPSSLGFDAVELVEASSKLSSGGRRPWVMSEGPAGRANCNEIASIGRLQASNVPQCIGALPSGSRLKDTKQGLLPIRPVDLAAGGQGGARKLESVLKATIPVRSDGTLYDL